MRSNEQDDIILNIIYIVKIHQAVHIGYPQEAL